MKSTMPKPFVFVVMPFSKEFDDVYQLGIKEACLKSGMYCERVDEQLFNERILDRIYNQISKADIIISDMSGRNENVFYEVGYAHGLGKKVILLTDNTKDIPFDLKDYPHIIYNGRIVDLIKPLVKKLKWSIKAPDTTRNISACPIELFNYKTKLVLDEKVSISLKDRNSLIISFHNSSGFKFSKNQIRIGILTDRDIQGTSDDKIVPQPDGRNLVLMRYKEELYPDEWGEFKVLHWIKDGEAFVIRLFLPTGSFEFPISVKVIPVEPEWVIAPSH